MKLKFYKCYLFYQESKDCLTCSNPMNCSLPGFSIHGIFQARVLEWVAIAFSDTMDYLLLIVTPAVTY